MKCRSSYCSVQHFLEAMVDEFERVCEDYLPDVKHPTLTISPDHTDISVQHYEDANRPSIVLRLPPSKHVVIREI